MHVLITAIDFISIELVVPQYDVYNNISCTGCPKKKYSGLIYNNF
jgi:hypothetical protein